MVPGPRARLAVALGTLLLSVAAFGPVGGAFPAYSYRVEAVTSSTDDLPSLLAWSPDVLACREAGTPRNADCALERRIRAGGPATIRNASDRPRRGYDVVLFRAAGGSATFYRATEADAGDATTYRLRRLSRAEALAAVAVRAEAVSEALVPVLEAGRVERTRPLTAWDAWRASTPVLEHEARYYRDGGSALRGSMRTRERVVRLVLGLAGAALLTLGWSRSDAA